jgi:WD40 repeat protein
VGLGEVERSFEVAFTADGKSLVSACGPVKFWDVRTGNLLRTLDPKGLMAHHVAVSTDGRHLVTDGVRKEKGKTVYAVLLRDAKTGELRQTLPWQNHSMLMCSLALSPDGRFLAVGAGTPTNVEAKDGHKTRGELRVVPLGLVWAEPPGR